jgi:peroxiredoxin
MSTLAQELEKITAATPFEAHAKLQEFVKQQQATGLATGLREGAAAKDFALKDAFGNDIYLYDELAKGPVVLTFYRGGWCPYCNRQLRAYQEILPEIEALGGQLIAISPQLPDQSLSFQEKADLTFKVLSDPTGIVSAAYNLLYDVSEGLKEAFLSLNINLKEYNGSDHWILPVPATFMIDEHGVIRTSYVNADFTKRLEPEEILWSLRSL